MNTPLVSVIIVNYNTPELVYACLDSLKAHIARSSYEVIVVDNGSPKPMNPEQLKTYPEVKYLPLSENRGFGAGNNAGVKQAKGELVWLLNSDTLLPSAKIEHLFEFLLAHPEVGLVSPLLYNDPELQTLQPDFYAQYQSFTTLLTRQAQAPIDISQPVIETEVVVGASMVMRRSVFETLGGFDEKIFMYFEDDDLCYRVQERGLSVVIFTGAEVVHLQGKSLSHTGKRKSLYYTSQNYFWQKHYGLFPALLMRLIRLPYRLVRGV